MIGEMLLPRLSRVIFMQRTPILICRFFWLLLLIPLAVACGSKQPPVPSIGLSKQGISITGKVTYKEKPVPYGYVQFFERGGMDPKTGMMYPVAVGLISHEGTYKADNVPVGKDLHIAVACDPDKHPRELSGSVTGVSLMPGTGPDPGKTGPIKDRPQPKLPPGIPPGKAPPMPGGASLQKHTEETKKLLSEIHRQFSSPMVSGQLHQFEAKDTTFDIHLVPGKRK